MPDPAEPYTIVPAPRVGRRSTTDARPNRWHVLDAADVADRSSPAVAYASHSLLISTLVEEDDPMEVLSQAADVFGWQVAIDPDYAIDVEESADRTQDRARRVPRATGPLSIRRVIISADPTQSVNEPDGWKLLQRARAIRGERGLRSVGLDHGIRLTPPGLRWPVSVSAAAADSPSSSYMYAGSGGREPVRYVGPAPEYGPTSSRTTRRPVVGLLDSGCGDHPWLTNVRRHVLDPLGQPIGHDDAASDSESSADLFGPLDGKADEISGHGTFMAGIVRQSCPSADIVSWRLSGSEGTVSESDLLLALSQIADLLEHSASAGTKVALDVLVLALGYYHEDLSELSQGHLLSEVLLRIRRAGTTVVCAAGNDSTDVPFLPAALCRWNVGPSLVAQAEPDDAAPLLSVGALNPNDTVALFSNSGPWVTCYAPGASVLSTTPATNAGAQPTSRVTAYGLQRETIDSDDSTSGFAIWSGTSFAAPYVAGWILRTLEPELPAPDSPEQAADIATAWRVVSELTGLEP
ncbi:subtilase family protein [Branchiibius hedensis]|uniref:Subtilase family protein n=1 Tax=Branchiibius hedensis TaxID=672460 RepID=A0A2Y8ZT68_9MICO|nr:S8/S53 family peptidase [Branchiibius hedensis]PWJ25873.1 subtilase family protein [Branchiibius hedensis]SSA34686.1 Subtilase family protein [Branchiibius hedensis]